MVIIADSSSSSPILWAFVVFKRPLLFHTHTHTRTHTHTHTRTHTHTHTHTHLSSFRSPSQSPLLHLLTDRSSLHQKKKKQRPSTSRARAADAMAYVLMSQQHTAPRHTQRTTHT